MNPPQSPQSATLIVAEQARQPRHPPPPLYNVAVVAVATARDSGKRVGRHNKNGVDAGLDRAMAAAQPGEGMSYAEIARFAGCSQSRIKQINQDALRRLRLYTDARLLEELHDELHARERKREVATPWIPRQITSSDLWRRG